MPGFYPEDEYDLAGFSVGIVDKGAIVDGSAMEVGDVLIGLPSSGVHSNGFSLVRKIFDVNKENLSAYVPELGATLGETLLTPTKIYVKSILKLLEEVKVKGIAHITGGGFYENIPRAIAPGLSAKINREDVRVLPIFDYIAKKGNIPVRDMFNTFNMGVGMTVCVAPEDADKTIDQLTQAGETAYRLGELVEGDGEVLLG